MAKTIELTIDGENKKFHRNEEINGKIARRGIKITVKLSGIAQGITDKNSEEFLNLLDQAEQFIAEDLFNNQFTVDDLQEGSDGNGYIEFLIEQTSSVMVDESGKPKKK